MPLPTSVDILSSKPINPGRVISEEDSLAEALSPGNASFRPSYKPPAPEPQNNPARETCSESSRPDLQVHIWIPTAALPPPSPDTSGNQAPSLCLGALLHQMGK